METETADLPAETDLQAVVTRFATTATSPVILPASAVSPDRRDRTVADPDPDPSSKIFNIDSNTTIAATTEEEASEVETVVVSAVATEVDSAVVTVVASVEVATSVAVTTAEVVLVSADLPAPAADLLPDSSAREEAPAAATLAESELN